MIYGDGIALDIAFAIKQDLEVVTAGEDMTMLFATERIVRRLPNSEHEAKFGTTYCCKFI